MKKVRLRALESHDLEFLYKLRQEPLIKKNLKFYWPISMQGQVEWFNKISNDKNNKLLIIEGNQSKYNNKNRELKWDTIGDARIQHIDHFNKTAEIGLDICENFRGKGFGKIAFKSIMDFCFNELNMRKLYLYVFSFNEAGISVYKKNGFETEGILKKHIFKNGKYEDLLLMSIFKEDLERIKK